MPRDRLVVHAHIEAVLASIWALVSGLITAWAVLVPALFKSNGRTFRAIRERIDYWTLVSSEPRGRTDVDLRQSA